jgi:uncharacterized membrane protein YhaH (DUF805 family)/Tfp pilus assembly protein PilE
MQDRNPYAAPQTNVAGAGAAEEYGEIRIFSPRGRLGRLRFIGYTTGLSLLIATVLLIAVAMTAAADPTLAIVVGAAGYIAIFIIQILLTIQRAHDMNTTGWLSLIVFVPLAALIFWFVPGTAGENRYGKPPPPNTAGVVILACLLPLVAIGGMLAAIAIPAYQDYTIRAQVSEGLNLAAAPRAAVAAAFERNGVAPADRLAAGLSADATDSGGQYVASVDVAGGTILVTYAGNAYPTIAGKVLAIQPYVMPDKSLVWRCGMARPPGGGAVALDSAARFVGAAGIDPRYLPSACR